MNMSRSQKRRGVTLVELMVICAILGVLMGMVLFALQGANEQARADRTRAEIIKINDLIMQRWDGYRTRPMPMRKTYLPGTQAQTIANDRLQAVWELMRMELPERITDIKQPASFLSNANGPVEPALWRAYRAKLVALTGAPDTDPTSKWTGEYSNAECLYLILSTIRDGDSNGLDFFTPREIGDLDGDNVPEILDGWGRPIRFLRWAPGYSEAYGAPTRMQTGNPATSPDPFDPYKLHTTHFALFPLIYSAGPDGGYGIKGDDDSNPVVYSSTTPWKNNPYSSLSMTPPIGGCIKENGYETWLDNITNHLQVVR